MEIIARPIAAGEMVPYARIDPTIWGSEFFLFEKSGWSGCTSMRTGCSMKSESDKSYRLGRRRVADEPLQFVPLEKRIEELRRERALIEKVIAALTEISKHRYAPRGPAAG